MIPEGKSEGGAGRLQEHSQYGQSVYSGQLVHRLYFPVGRSVIDSEKKLIPKVVPPYSFLTEAPCNTIEPGKAKSHDGTISWLQNPRSTSNVNAVREVYPPLKHRGHVTNTFLRTADHPSWLLGTVHDIFSPFSKLAGVIVLNLRF